MSLEGVDKSFIDFNRASLTFFIDVAKFENSTQPKSVSITITLKDPNGQTTIETLKLTVEAGAKEKEKDASASSGSGNG